MSAAPVLEVRDLVVEAGRGEPIRAVDGVSLALAEGECLGLVGESGCGKTLLLRAIAGLLPPLCRLSGGDVRVGTEHAPRPSGASDGRRANLTAMVFQDPATALNPTLRVGDLVAEGLRVRGLSRRTAREQAVDLLGRVGIPDPALRAAAWPHELSGGLRRRAMIAVALAAAPRVLLCDEPTGGLDPTVQDQILRLLDRLRGEGPAVLLVSHDVGIVARIADRLAVMYAGEIVEEGPAAAVLAAPRHPYTRALLQALPDPERPRRRLVPVPGRPPDPAALPSGCRFAPRCPLVERDCEAVRPALEPVGTRRSAACRRHGELVGVELR